MEQQDVDFVITDDRQIDAVRFLADMFNPQLEKQNINSNILTNVGFYEKNEAKRDPDNNDIEKYLVRQIGNLSLIGFVKTSDYSNSITIELHDDCSVTTSKKPMKISNLANLNFRRNRNKIEIFEDDEGDHIGMIKWRLNCISRQFDLNVIISDNKVVEIFFDWFLCAICSTVFHELKGRGNKVDFNQIQADRGGDGSYFVCLKCLDTKLSLVSLCYIYYPCAILIVID